MSKAKSAFFIVLQLAFLGAITFYWFQQIEEMVPAPYLDEVFHVRQAQQYIHGRWHVWDPKITTPPGLYLVSYVKQWVLDFFTKTERGGLSSLRAVNAWTGSLFIFVLGKLILRWITDPYLPLNGQDENDANVKMSRGITLGHVAVNLCLFPPLFFFTGLYYTDVLSAFSVLTVYFLYLENKQNWLAIAGLVSLAFRQTNIFWSGIFFAGLELCRTLPRGRPHIEFPQRATLLDVLHGSWAHSCVYDPSIHEASIQDYFMVAISFVIASLRNLSEVLWNLSSHIVILCAFLEFVVWNGGVVLGDKSNHVASLHLAQMLYIWPYFTFFSFPLLLPYLLDLFIPRQYIPRSLHIQESARPQFPRYIIATPIILGILAIVRYNTIVHPFTLADNRHYMFYVFRLLLFKHPLIKYLAVPVYFTCGWLCLFVLGSPPSSSPSPAGSNGNKSKKDTMPDQSRNRNPAATPRASFLLIWLLTTTLSLCTAPLVEPRYFILPWLTWRMHVAAAATTMAASSTDTSHPTNDNDNDKTSSKQHYFKYSLYVETIWFLAINAATGYMFLRRGFEWPQEPGSVQRFMW